MINLPMPYEEVEKAGLTDAEFYYLLFRLSGGDDETIEKELIDKDIGSPCRKNTNKVFFTSKTKDFVETVISNIRKQQEMERKKVEINPDFIPLAKKMQALYPVGIRPGCSKQWRGSSIIIAKKLTMLTTQFYAEFTEEQALDAVKRYVESFRGEYNYMECLEYFVLRLRPSFKSNFMEYIENTEAGEEDSEDFMLKLR